MSRIALYALTLILANALSAAAVSLRETVAERPLVDAAQAAMVAILGRAEAGKSLQLRVTDSLGRETRAGVVALEDGRFSARYPADFPGAAPLEPGVLFIDALADDETGVPQAEAALIVYRSTGAKRLPVLPSAFTTDLRGAKGETDERSPEWERTRALANLYMRSRGAALAKAGKPGFDLADTDDLRFFKERRALYDFERRDRDWTQPLGRRVARTFWLASARNWFGPGKPAFAFSNDHADLLVAALRRLRLAPVTLHPLEDNLGELCTEALANLLALQRGADDAQEPVLAVEGGGAFYYGMFADGTLMLPGTGWFEKPEHNDHRAGGVFVARSAWALGEALAADASGPRDPRTLAALRAALRWCFGESRAHRDGDRAYLHTVRAADGRELPLWRSAGEHAYLLMGMIAACTAPGARDTEIFSAGEHGFDRAQTLESLTLLALDTLTAARNAHGYWTRYADIDATAVAALARGAQIFPDALSATNWRAAATKAADGWMAARPRAGDYRGEVILLAGHRPVAEPGRLNYHSTKTGGTHLTYFHAALWLQALAELHALTGEARYAAKFAEQLGYFCGNNPFDARLFTEFGGVYNYVTDRDGDTIEDHLVFNLYPESSAFLQIGLLRHLEVLTTDSTRASTNLSHP